MAYIENVIDDLPAVSVMEVSVDGYVPQPELPVDRPFLMTIEDIFLHYSLGTMVAGKIESGIVKKNQEIEIVGLRNAQKAICAGVVMFHKLLDEGRAGDNVSILLRNIKPGDVERGQVLAKPGTISSHAHFEAESYILNKEEGGVQAHFFANNNPATFYFRFIKVSGAIELPEVNEMVMSNNSIKLKVALKSPIAMNKGLKFDILEAGRTVGAGVVTKILK